MSEQLTRAGIDLLKSGFSRFGFGVGNTSGAKTGGNRRILGNAQVLVVFVVGGITFEEVRCPQGIVSRHLVCFTPDSSTTVVVNVFAQVQEVHSVLQELPFQVILGGTTITNNEVIVEQVFKQ